MGKNTFLVLQKFPHLKNIELVLNLNEQTAAGCNTHYKNTKMAFMFLIN